MKNPTNGKKIKKAIDKCVYGVYNKIKGWWSLKRKDLIKLFEKNGWWLLREGGNHTVYTNGKTNEPISRQTEINDILASKIIKRRKLK